MARVTKVASIGPDAAVCAQCGIDRSDPTPEQKRKLAPPCWHCVERFLQTKGSTPPPLYPGCKQCLNKPLADLECVRCGVYLHWTALIAHGAKAVPLSDYPAGFRIKYCAALGEPEFERPFAIAFLVDLLWRQRAFEGTDQPGPLDRYRAELRRVYGFIPELMTPALKRYEQEIAGTKGFEKRREMASLGEILEEIVVPPMREPGED